MAAVSPEASMADSPKRHSRDFGQVFLSSAISGTAVGILCTPFDVVKNYWLFAASKSAALADELAALSRSKALSSPLGTPCVKQTSAKRGTAGGASAYYQLSNASTPSQSSRTIPSFILETKEILRQAEAESCGRGSITARSSTWEVAKCLYTSEGLSVFWRGFFPALCVLVPANVIFFSLYERRAPEWGEALAGVYARSVAVFATAPAELARTKLQASCYCRGNCNSSVTDGPVGVVRNVLREEGLRGLFKGVGPTLIRDVPFSALYWPMIGAATHFWGGILEGLSGEASSQSVSGKGGLREKALLPFLAGASSSAVACVLTHPMDVLKTKVQASLFSRATADTRGVKGLGREALDAFKDIFNQQGLRGFAVGLVPRLCKIVPSCAVLLASYEGSKALWSVALGEDF